jgi:transposase InsO family protein
MNKQPLPDPRAKQRLRWINHYAQVTKKVAPTCRYFGITRGTFYLWYHRYLSLGVEGLRSKSCRPHKIQRWLPKEIRETILSLRLQRRYGPHRMSWYLQQKYHWYVSKNTIWRLYKEHGLNRLKYKKRWQRYPQQYAKALPGDRVQLDVKFLDRIGLEGKKYYQFTAIDDCTRFRVLRIYDHNTVKSAVDFIDQVKQALPFVIKQVQTDNGSEFSETFSWHLEDLGIHHRKTRIRSPEENVKVERSHRTDEEEFYGLNRFVSIHHLTKLLAQWEKEYNGQRPHMALGGKTPREFLTEKLKNHYSKQMLTVPVKTVQDVG